MQDPVARKKLSRKAAFYDYLPFLEAEVTAWLFPNQQEGLNPSLLRESTAQEGPGELLKWKAFSQDPECFTSKIAEEKPPKKKIIISNALLKDRAPSPGELTLLSDLIKHYEVYLWQGPGSNLSKATPLSSADEFWRLRETIQPATAACIKKYFAEQLMAADQWLILDKAAYDERWGMMEGSIDLTGVDLGSAEKYQELLQSVDCSQIMDINLLAPRAEVLQFICQHFKNLQSISFTRVSARWLEQNIALLAGSQIDTVELINPIIEGEKNSFSLSLEKNFGIKTLVIAGTAKVTINANETLKVYSFSPKPKLLGKARAGKVSQYLLRQKCHDIETSFYKTKPISVKTLASYEALSAQEENRTIKALSLELFWDESIHLDKVYLKVFSTLATNFPSLQLLILGSPFELGQTFTVSHPAIESFIVRSGMNVIVEEMPKLTYLSFDPCKEGYPILPRLPALRWLKLPLNSEKFWDLEQLTPCLESLTVDQTYADSDSPEIILSDSIKSLLFEVEYEVGRIFTIHGGKNLRDLSLDTCTSDINLQLAKCQRLRQIFSTETTPSHHLINSIDSVPPSLLVMDVILAEQTSEKFRKHLPVGCATNGTEAVASRSLPSYAPPSEHKSQPQLQSQPPQPSRPYTFFLPQDEESLDEPDGRPGTLDLSETSASGRLQYSLSSAEEIIDDGDYRIQILDGIAIDDTGQILFYSKARFLTEGDYQHFAKFDPTTIDIGSRTHKGMVMGRLQVGKNYPLALKAPVVEQELELYAEFEPPEAAQYFTIGIHENSSQQHYYVRLIAQTLAIHVPPTKVTLHYWYTPKGNYQSKRWSDCQRIPEEKPSFSPRIKAEIQSVVTSIPKLQPILDEQVNIADKLKLIIDYLRNFKAEKALVSSHPKGSLKRLLDTLQQECGLCGPRAQLFMLLAHFLEVKAQLIGNRVHAYGEISDKLIDSWTHVCLSGGDLQYTGSLSPAAALPLLAQIDNPYEARIAAHLDKTAAFSWTDFDSADSWSGPSLTDQAKKPLPPVLIRVPQKLDMSRVRQDYFNPSQIIEPYLFINTPADFKKYWQCYTLQADGSRRLVPGPLQDIFAKGGILFINWTNFTIRQQLSYRSLWADPPRWEDKPITSRALKIVGFLSESLTIAPSFIPKRGIRGLPPRIGEAKLSAGAPVIAPTTRRFDVFKSKSWQELLIADIQFVGKKARFIEGFLYFALAEAAKQTTPYHLTIHQPPDDSEFAQWLEEINVEKRFFFNGKLIRVPDNFLVTTTTEPLHPLPEKLPFNILFDLPPGYKHSCLHLNNWHTLYSDTTVDEDGGLQSKPGCLAALAKEDASKTLFYVTQTIPDHDWQHLAYIMAKRYPKQRLAFQFAKGVIPPRQLCPALPTSTSSTPFQPFPIKPAKLGVYVKQKGSFCWVTNDPAYLAESLERLCSVDQQPMIVDLTPAMTGSDLLESMRPKPAAASDEFNFIREKRFLFSALQAGKTVILKGRVSSRLLQELAPLFLNPPYLEFNGEQIAIPGRLMLVLPAEAAKNSAFLYPLACDFDADDYRNGLLMADKAEQKGRKTLAEAGGKDEARVVEKLLRFFYLARMPHRGRSMPADLGINFTRLLQMKRALLAPAHPTDHQHNRIKGLMLFGYVKGSEEYAFLNVLCKLLFDKNIEKPFRQDKFQGLQASVQTSGSNSSDFAWRILNTCSGPKLHKLLGRTLRQDILNKDRPPESSLLHYWQQHPSWNAVFKTLEKQATARRVIPATSILARLSSPAMDQPQTYQLEKMKQRLAYGAQSDTGAKVIIIKGEPGVGKTHYLEELAKNPAYSCSVGLDKIEQWLNDRSDKPKLLLLDEANTLAPGMLDLLDGIYRNPPVIVYKGRTYHLSPQHKIFAAVNPEYFSGRSYHLFLSKGKTVIASMPDLAYLENYLAETYGLSSAVAKHLLAGAELFNRCPLLRKYSFRDLQNLAQLYQVLASQAGATEPHILYQTLYGHFAITLSDPAIKQQYDSSLRQQLGLPARTAADDDKPIYVNHTLFPSEMQDAHLAISQALDIRKHILDKAEAKAAPELLAYKRGLLLQGGAGIGKKMLCRQLLIEKNMQPAGSEQLIIDPTKHYLEVTAGQSNFRAIALQAFDAGAILVVNQLNFLSPEDESFLGGLLMNRYENRAAKKPGFMLLATQDPGSELGGGALSPALGNRMQILSLPAYADASWELLAQQKLADKKQARQFVQAFWQPKQEHPKAVTGHDFFECLEIEAALLAASKKETTKRGRTEETSPSHQVKKGRIHSPSGSSSFGFFDTSPIALSSSSADLLDSETVAAFFATSPQGF